MINVARQLGGITKSGQPIQFLVAPAEKCASIGGAQNGTDILISAMAVSRKAHAYLRIERYTLTTTDCGT
jgi:hypothetical protein